MLLSRLLLTVIVSLVIGSVSAHADIDIFMCSTSIPGESNTVGFEGCNEILAFGERIEFLADDASKPGKEVELLPVEMRKPFDVGSPIIRMLALTDMRFGGVVSFRRDGEFPFVFLQIDLLSAKVVRIKMDGASDDTTEIVTIVPEQIVWTYTEQNNDGTAGEQTVFSYDVASGMSF